MGRWEPDAPGRLQRAALELYAERGYEQTTVAEIAERAGLTERSFFRHFADKREVLFHGSAQLQQGMVEAVRAAPADIAPLDAVAAGLLAATEPFADHRRHSVRRQSVIAAHPALQERELSKLAALSAALAATLRERGVAEPAASLTAEAGMSVFKVAFERWVQDGNRRTLPVLIEEAVTALRAVAGRA